MKKRKLYLPVRLSYLDSGPYMMQLHTHREYEILYFHHGHCTYIIGTHIFVPQPGDLLLLDGKTLHTSNPVPGNYCRTTIHFDPSYLSTMLNHSILTSAFDPFEKLSNHIIHLKGDTRMEIEQQLKKMDDLFKQNDTASYHRFLLSLLDLLYYIHPFCLAPDQELSKLSEKEHHVQRLLSYLEQHYASELDLEQLESEMYLNKTYLCKIFKEITGETIFIYLNKLRLNHAKIMFMMDKDISVSEVCYKVGYKHLSHFSRLFKQEFDCTPNQFRQMVDRDQKRMVLP